jgi:hypothetical protein
MSAKLPPSHLRVLRDAANGDVYRSHSINTLYQSFNRADRHKTVTAIVERLTDRPEPLLKVGELDGFVIPWLLTDAGRAALDAHQNA